MAIFQGRVFLLLGTVLTACALGLLLGTGTPPLPLR